MESARTAALKKQAVTNRMDKRPSMAAQCLLRILSFVHIFLLAVRIVVANDATCRTSTMNGELAHSRG
jgi:hypothetical protein